MDPGWFNDVLISGLQPSTTYYYQVSGSQANQYSEVFSFTTAQIPAATENLLFYVYGDMGEGATLIPEAKYTAQNVLGAIQETGGFVMHIGDISYARSKGYVWELFFNLIESIAANFPYMVDVGNHEYDHLEGAAEDPSGYGLGFHPSWGNYDDDSSGECGRPFYERFHMPETGFQPWWWSFNAGPMHIIHMSTEHDYTNSSKQYAWLESDLASVNRSVTPWVVLAGHRPMYTSENYTDDHLVAEHMQMAFENLLNQYNVDLALWGHYHSYERTCAVFNYTCQNDVTSRDYIRRQPNRETVVGGSPQGTVHLIIGTAGCALDNVAFLPYPWSVNHALAYGYGKVTVNYDSATSDSCLNFQFIENNDNSVYDQFQMCKTL